MERTELTPLHEPQGTFLLPKFLSGKKSLDGPPFLVNSVELPRGAIAAVIVAASIAPATHML